jgi:acyl-coenzyme A thioesterase PaaI-like protein
MVYGLGKQMGVFMSESQESSGCFACGAANRCGLGLVFETDEEARSASARTVLGASFAGADGIAHGGIVATLLDEAMAYASRTAATSAATAELRVRYRQPTPVGRELVVRGWVVSCRHGAVRCEASVALDGVVLAEGTGTFLVVPERS